MQLHTPHNLSRYRIPLVLVLFFTSMVMAACNPVKEAHTTTDNHKLSSNTKTVTGTRASTAKPTDSKVIAVTDFIQSAVNDANNVDNTPIPVGSNASTTSHEILTTGKKLNAISMSASESPRDDGIHDTVNDAIVILQNPAVAMKDFPRDRRQQVDWVQALAQGLIEPRADLLGKGSMTELDLDIMMKNTQFMPWVKFPHDRHTKWLACSNCHPAIFEAKEHANPITMNKVLRGEYCGVCHDKVAFALFTCERCHSVPHEGSGPKWW
ncbi:MAG: hypothetical protein COB30_020725 [Ectothiorhodospiraceae bacterium]|nr:hypothetical protein [Ectothiorhodospiraceae bacterium]